MKRYQPCLDVKFVRLVFPLDCCCSNGWFCFLLHRRNQLKDVNFLLVGGYRNKNMTSKKGSPKVTLNPIATFVLYGSSCSSLLDSFGLQDSATADFPHCSFSGKPACMQSGIRLWLSLFLQHHVHFSHLPPVILKKEQKHIKQK